MTTTDLIVYSRPDCGYCRKLLGRLAASDVPFQDRPVEGDAEAVAFVESANGGDCIVPTVVFPDGHVATNPSWAAVTTRLGVGA